MSLVLKLFDEIGAKAMASLHSIASKLAVVKTSYQKKRG